VVKIPDDEWLCDKCTAGCKGESCALCPSTKGAMKRTTDWKWAHLSCSMWIPEVYYRQPDGRDPIDYLQIPAYRWGNTCFYCKSTHGACMQCSHEGCKMMFHITCAMEHGVFLEYKTNNKGADLIHALCEEHAKRWIGKAKKK
jgi:NuA3 HAT complex component NTO1